MRRSLALALPLSLVCVGLALAPPPSPAAAAGPTVLTLELNVLGLVGSANGSSRDASVNYVLTLMGQHDPLVVALSEICYEQFDDIRGFAAAAGWPYHVGYRVAYRRILTGDDAAGCRSYANPSTHAEYGNAILLRYAPQGDSYGYYYQDRAGDGSRNMVCVDTVAFLYQYKACSTHLTTNASTRPSQRDENAWILSNLGGVVFGAGDYNQGRSLITGTPLDTAFWEADGSSPKRATRHLSTDLLDSCRRFALGGD